ncbi:syntaxin-51 isoform X2 [Prunus persica]|nr:syntaxin-51 isoform X2 [Prunus persica]
MLVINAHSLENRQKNRRYKQNKIKTLSLSLSLVCLLSVLFFWLDLLPLSISLPFLGSNGALSYLFSPSSPRLCFSNAHSDLNQNPSQQVRLHRICKVMASPDSWMREFNDASKLADEINGMISGRSSLPPSGPETQRHMSATRRKVTILRTKLETLQSLLSKLPNKQSITGKEINRRKDMLTNLSSKADQMAIALNMSSLANKQNLLGPDKKMDDIMRRTEDLDNHGLVSFQRQIMKEQDEGLGKLEETVISTKHIALAVNEELDLHTMLLDNLDQHVDSTNSNLQRVQKKFAVLNKRTKGGCSSLILLVLAVVILIIVTWALIKYL